MDATFTRAEAGLRCDLAAALHVTGEREEARRPLTAPRNWPSSPVADLAGERLPVTAPSFVRAAGL